MLSVVVTVIGPGVGLNYIKKIDIPESFSIVQSFVD